MLCATLEGSLSQNVDLCPGLFFMLWGLPLIMYASRGGGGVNPHAYKCVQGGRGGLNMTKNMHFVCRLIENAIISAQRKVNG